MENFKKNRNSLYPLRETGLFFSRDVFQFFKHFVSSVSKVFKYFVVFIKRMSLNRLESWHLAFELSTCHFHASTWFSRVKIPSLVAESITMGG